MSIKIIEMESDKEHIHLLIESKPRALYSKCC
ncbi:transposase [Pseudogracilibacillus sp. SO30301A]